MNKIYFLLLLGVLVVIVGYFSITWLQNKKQTGTTNPTQSNAINVQKNSTLGSFITDTKGFSLYTFTKDSEDVSRCTNTCLKIWPAYIATQHAKLLRNITIFKRSDGQFQYAYKAKPLYYYSGDQKSGDTNGEGIGNNWFVAKE